MFNTEQNRQKENLKPDIKNVILNSLVEPNNILLIPLHTKIGRMKQFAKAIPEERDCFKYLCKKFFGLSEAKLSKRGPLLVQIPARKLPIRLNYPLVYPSPSKNIDGKLPTMKGIRPKRPMDKPALPQLLATLRLDSQEFSFFKHIKNTLKVFIPAIQEHLF
ncbi:hypothetical protein TNCV_4604031 [Trichonephila clavipes]|nr:hypothetical protein TNCV_4604031 [Trichonephila clavipes]